MIVNTSIHRSVRIITIPGPGSTSRQVHAAEILPHMTSEDCAALISLAQGYSPEAALLVMPHAKPVLLAGLVAAACRRNYNCIVCGIGRKEEARVIREETLSRVKRKCRRRHVIQKLLFLWTNHPDRSLWDSSETASLEEAAAALSCTPESTAALFVLAYFLKKRPVSSPIFFFYETDILRRVGEAFPKKD